MIKLNLNENFISRIWEEKSYYSDLKTTCGKNVVVLNTGMKNEDEGPDFKNAGIYIDGKLFSGDVEIHKSLSDWKTHKHRKKDKYNLVILQVVMWDDDNPDYEIPKAKKSRYIPTVILSRHLTKSIHTIWREIINNPSPGFKLPCHPANSVIPAEDKISVLENMGRKRLIYRMDRISARLDNLIFKGFNPKNSFTWEQILLEFVFEALGFSKNKTPFLKLAQNIDLRKIRSLNLSALQFDALLYGTAGMLNNVKFKDEYILNLKKYRDELLNILKFEIMDYSDWNFFRLRPQNFPSVRISYASAFCYELINNDLMKKLTLSFEHYPEPADRIRSIFLGIKPSDYWDSRYNFGKTLKKGSIKIGKERIDDIIINVVYPFLLLYSKFFDKKLITGKIYTEYSKMKGFTKNEITKVMEKQLEVKINKTICSQGAIHLHNFYCVKGKCDDCNIGNKIFVKEESLNYLKIILY
jgi:hypothetical protein